MEIKIISFSDLSNIDLHNIMQLRQSVFVVEQNCPYLDSDDYDPVAHHCILKVNNQIAAVTRILPPGNTYEKYSSIGRVVNKNIYRGKGYGNDIMKASIDFCKKNYPSHDIKISAQTYLRQFYSNLGFKATGEYYLEDNIPHMAMIYSLKD